MNNPSSQHSPETTPTYRKTCQRYNIPGNAHALTFSCYQRLPLLNRDRTRNWLIESLQVASVKHQFEIWSYVIMPEHVHVVIFPVRDQHSISKILTDIKQPVTRKAVKYLRDNKSTFLKKMQELKHGGKITHRFWQRGGGYDRNLVQVKAIYKTIDYIHANPVRRGLVKSPHDWYWSSCRHYTGSDDLPLLPNNESLPPRD